MSTRVAHLTSLHIALDTRVFYKECRTLAQAGYDVHLVVHDPPVEEQDGVTFHAIPRATGSKWTRAVERLRSVYRIARSLDAAAYHFHDPELIPVGIALKKTGAKVIYDAHEDAPNQAMRSLKFRPVDARILAAFYTVYERMAARLLDGFVMAWPGLEERFPRSKRIVIANYP
ncbi:MAG TPA: glycosyltransferase, partial [Rhodothermales bacterium]|nr:glycosyltransferase [Rhodothermales bacterium]